MSHISVLERAGFKRIAVKVNDRGNGVDTVYFGRAARDDCNG